jgi:hypothetical protein
MLTISLSTTYQERPLEEYDRFRNHEQFQSLSIQLIESLISVDQELSPLLIEFLSCILRIDPLIVTTTSAMNMALYFFLTTPEYPVTRHELTLTFDFWVLRALWSVAYDDDEKETMGEMEVNWLVKVVEMVQTASTRHKDDPLVSVLLTCVCLADVGFC